MTAMHLGIWQISSFIERSNFYAHFTVIMPFSQMLKTKEKTRIKKLSKRSLFSVPYVNNLHCLDIVFCKLKSPTKIMMNQKHNNAW